MDFRLSSEQQQLRDTARRFARAELDHGVAGIGVDRVEVGERPAIVLDVLDDIKSANQIKAAVGEWQGGNLAERRNAATGPQGRQRWLADFDEVRAGDGKSWAQAWADFESRRC